jgi:hypothetical protein
MHNGTAHRRQRNELPQLLKLHFHQLLRRSQGPLSLLLLLFSLVHGGFHY